MKKYFILLSCVLIMLLSSCSDNNDGKQTNVTNTENKTDKKENQTKNTAEAESENKTVDMVIIADDESDEQLAAKAANEGLNVIFVTTLENTGDELNKLSDDENLELLTATYPNSLLLDNDNNIRGLRVKNKDSDSLMIESKAVVIAFKNTDEISPDLLGFLPKDKDGALMLDDKGRVLRNANAQGDVPRKCAVALKKEDANLKEPEFKAIEGLYSIVHMQEISTDEILESAIEYVK